MKKKIFSFLGMIEFLLVGCGGGGGGTSISYDDPTIIENKLFYRVQAVDQTRYLKERFDGNGELDQVTYLIEDDEFPEDNKTIPYEIQSTQVYIYDDITIRCWVLDRDDSVAFYCLEEGVSGSIPSEPSTIRWNTKEDAIANPG